MALDKPRHPKNFPAGFHNVMRQEEGKHLLMTLKEPMDAEREARRFRAFLKSLDVFSGHQSAKDGRGKKFRTLVRRDALTDTWDFFVIVEDNERMLRAALASMKGVTL